MSCLARITIHPQQRGGLPCIRHTQILVADILQLLDVGVTESEILSEFPDLVGDDLRACREYRESRTPAPVARRDWSLEPASTASDVFLSGVGEVLTFLIPF